MRKQLGILMFVAGAVLVPAAVGRALDLPYTEDFATDNAAWTDVASAPLDYEATGGSDGNGYVTDEVNFTDLEEGDTRVVFRAEPGVPSIIPPASGGSFFGVWEPGVDEFSFQVRHDAAIPLTYFARFAGPFNFPGGVAINFIPVLPNTWTEVSIPINALNPQFVTFEGMTFEDVFTNVGNLQIGISVPAALDGADVDVTFDFDQPAIVPEPASVALVGLALCGLLACRRRRIAV